MKIVKRGMITVAVAGLVMATLLIPADPASAKTKFHFGLNLWAPLTPY